MTPSRSLRRKNVSGPSAAILLSIRREHAERIFQGTKHYELRKVLPSSEFGRVFLYETGGGGVVGCFDVDFVLRRAIDPLWRAVGNAATTRKRFYEYFKATSHGYAIKIKSAVRFLEPVSIGMLNGHFGRIAPPQSFIVLESGDPLWFLLEQERLRAMSQHPPTVTLRRIGTENRGAYRKLVMRHIRPNYDEIDESFVSSTLRIHDLGYDPAGFFTTRKEVLEICDSRRRVIGFTTLTHKSGGCVKTGPTVLRGPFRSKGYGLATRMAIEERLQPAKVRKIYCTCPEKSERVARYLLASGMRIEAHLERHYAFTHNELVFGKLLVADEPSSALKQVSVADLRGTVSDPTSFDRETLVADFRRLFEITWSPVTRRFVRAVVAQALRGPIGKKDPKPKRLVCLRNGKHCVAAVALLPKRGGAVKGLLLRGTRHNSSLRDLLAAVSSLASDLGRRKLYFIHPVFDSTALAIFRSAGFQTEGLIRAPYRPGQDAVVVSKFL